MESSSNTQVTVERRRRGGQVGGRAGQHYLPLLQHHHADRVVVLEKGQVVLAGPAADLAAAPAALDRYLGV